MLFETVLMFTGFVSNNKYIDTELKFYTCLSIIRKAFTSTLNSFPLTGDIKLHSSMSSVKLIYRDKQVHKSKSLIHSKQVPYSLETNF